MKILQVTNFFKPSWESGGPARNTYELSKRLIERGHDVTVYTTDGFKTRLDVEKNKPVEVDGIRTYYFKNLSGYLARKMTLPIPYYLPIVARRELRNFDVIHIHEYRMMLAVVIHHYAKKYGVPYILQARGSLVPYTQKGRRFKNIVGRFFGYSISKDASKVIALTKTEVEQYKNKGVDEDKIVIVPNGIDPYDYNNLPRRGEFRRRYLIGADEKIILYLGRIHKIKGIDLLVKAFADLVKELVDIRLVIVGPDDGFLLTLKKQIEDLKIDDKILLTGPLYERDKLKAYVDADVYVLPSVHETFPATVLEACACSTPVVVTDRCGIADFVDKVGYVVEYDRDQLRDVILRILSDDELRVRFGEKGKRLVGEEFEWSVIIKQIEKIYRDVISEVIR